MSASQRLGATRDITALSLLSQLGLDTGTGGESAVMSGTLAQLNNVLLSAKPGQNGVVRLLD
jgi:hypothetical protein